MNILLAGEGGQGIQTIAETLAYAASLSGLNSSYLPQFGVEQRGTPSVAFVIIDKKPFSANRFKIADIAIVLRERAITRVVDQINPKTTLVFDSSTINRELLPKNHGRLLAIPATKIAKENLQPKVFNTIVLGAICKLIPGLDEAVIFESLKHFLGKKFIQSPALAEMNKKALDLGFKFVFEKDKFSAPSFQVSSKPITVVDEGKKSTVYPSLCKGCGICIEKCPVGAISFSEEIGFFGNSVPKIDHKKCILCHNCSVFCPDTAITIEKKSK
jgi:2-oxoglutarate ferredoxin oxidoreductase subunit gamma